MHLGRLPACVLLDLLAQGSFVHRGEGDDKEAMRIQVRASTRPPQPKNWPLMARNGHVASSARRQLGASITCSIQLRPATVFSAFALAERAAGMRADGSFGLCAEGDSELGEPGGALVARSYFARFPSDPERQTLRPLLLVAQLG
jgi:hypothetical protein